MNENDDKLQEIIDHLDDSTRTLDYNLANKIAARRQRALDQLQQPWWSRWQMQWAGAVAVLVLLIFMLPIRSWYTQNDQDFRGTLAQNDEPANADQPGVRDEAMDATRLADAGKGSNVDMNTTDEGSMVDDTNLNETDISLLLDQDGIDFFNDLEMMESFTDKVSG